MYEDFADILAAAKSNPGRVVIPAAENPEALEAIGQAMAAGILNGGSFIGNPVKIEEIADEVHLDLSPFEIVPCDDHKQAGELAVQFIHDKKGEILLKGDLMTSEYLKPILNHESEMVPKGSLLSHVSLMQIPTYHKFLMLSDPAVNIAPTVEDKKKIVMHAVHVMQKLGIRRPRVAMIAALEKVNPKIPSTVEAAQVAKELSEEFPDELYIEGPYDILIAVSKHAAEEKHVTGDVAGNADIIIFHEINGANAVYKIFTAFMPDYLNAAIVTGAKIPLILPSRADPVSTKLLSIALAAVLKDSPNDSG